MPSYIVRLHEVGMGDVATVGGKNASLGEMLKALAPKGIRIPDGFVVTADGYRAFLKETGLDVFIKEQLSGLNTKNLKDLAKRGAAIREKIKKTALPPRLIEGITKGYKEMEREHGKDTDVAVRSSATAEDLPGASFAGEHETYLGIRGVPSVLDAVRAAMASLFTDRAISYRVDKGFAHESVALSVGVQKMVRSDKGASGVMFSIDTESGFKNAVIINGAWGLGEMVVQGEVTPDEFVVFKPHLENKKLVPILRKTMGEKNRKMIYAPHGSGLHETKIVKTSPKEESAFVLSDEEILTLARWGKQIEDHYTAVRNAWTPMDMEWAKDGETGDLYIVQARPETIHAGRDYSILKEYRLKDKAPAVLVKGASVGSAIAQGKARVIMDAKQAGTFKKGEILVTDMTDPDWEPIMKMASAIITDKGGRTSHAAIVSRELGIPAIVGTEQATRKIKTGMALTVDTTGGDGLVYPGTLPFKVETHTVKNLPQIHTKVMVNVAMPEEAFQVSLLPVAGVGLAREEFIIASEIGMHPLALLNEKKLDAQTRKLIDQKTRGAKDKAAWYVERLASGIGTIGAAFFPRPVIVRFSDFKTNEYRTLLGGELFEPKEENPMIGWRGASRYYDPRFKDAFILECKALQKVRDTMGLTNVIPMVPFCRTPEEGKKTRAIMKAAGLESPCYVMCEIPANVIRANEFLDIFDGMSIGSNDLTQLALGLDRDAGMLTHIGNENDPTVKALVSQAIDACKARGKYIGICGQAPSDHPDFLEFLIEKKIESVSLNPDTVISAIQKIGTVEART